MSINLQNNQLLLWSIIIVLVLICLWLVYQTINQSVTLDHQTQYAEMINKQRDLLAKVLNFICNDINENVVRDVLSKLPDNTVFEKEEGHIVADQVSFFFSNGKFIRVDVGQKADEK